MDGWTFGRILVSPWVGGKGDGRADGRSIEQIRVAVGRTVRRPRVEHTDGGKGKRSEGRSLPRTGGRSQGRRSDVQTVGRTVGRTDGRSHGLGHDQSQGSGADRTPDRAIGMSKERQEQTPTDVLCAWMQRSAAPAGQCRDGSQPCPTCGGHFRLLRG